MARRPDRGNGGGTEDCEFRKRLRKIADDLEEASTDLGTYRPSAKPEELKVVDLHIQDLNDLAAKTKKVLEDKFFVLKPPTFTPSKPRKTS